MHLNNQGSTKQTDDTSKCENDSPQNTIDYSHVCIYVYNKSVAIISSP